MSSEEEIVSRARFVRDQIRVLGGFISEQQKRINKLLSSFVGFVGAILTAIFTVQVFDRKMHYATSWTLPVLLIIAYVVTIAAISPMAYCQFIAFDIKRRLVIQLNMLVDVGSGEGAVLMRNNSLLFNSLLIAQMEVYLRGGQSLRLWCIKGAGFLLALTVFSLVLLISCKRLVC